MFDYELSILGLDGVPLKTNKIGVIALVDAFGKKAMTSLVVEQIDKGIPYKNSLIQISISQQEKLTKPAKKSASKTSKIK